MPESAKVATIPTKPSRNGGRGKGTPNRDKAALWQLLKQEYGKDFHPIMKMAHNATILQTRVDDAEANHSEDVANQASEPRPAATLEQLRETITAWERVAKYTCAQYKAVEFNPADVDDGIGKTARERLEQLIGSGAA
ncbi:MAG: hypothetical protein GY813_03625 [Halieaceae bacterium]|nr:hypothetical protein [Halieaceae bacterium]